MAINNTPSLNKLHEAYCRLTGMNIRPTMQCLFAWEKFVSEGWTERDLEIVTKHIQKRIKQKRRYPESLAFRNLVGNLERFAEDLAEANAENRVVAPHSMAEKIWSDRDRLKREKPQPETTQMAGNVAQQWIEKMRRAVDYPEELL